MPKDPRDRLRSAVWDYTEKSEDKNFIICRVCDKRMAYYGNTSNVREHLRRAHKLLLKPQMSRFEEPKSERITPDEDVDDTVIKDIIDSPTVEFLRFREGRNSGRETRREPSPEFIKINTRQSSEKRETPRIQTVNETPRSTFPSRQFHPTSRSGKDEFDVYGEYIAMKLRSLEKMSCIYVQKAFSEIIFDAELGKYNVPQAVVEVNYTTSEPTATSSTARTAHIEIIPGSSTTLNGENTGSNAANTSESTPNSESNQINNIEITEIL